MKKPSVSIYIDGDALPTFKHFSLNQSMYDHHSFELVVGHGVIEDPGSHVLDRSKSWIGKVFHAEFGENEFIGIITSVDMSHFHGMHGDLIVQGYSPTILLEARPHKRSWLEKTLKDIVGDTVNEAGIDINPAPAHTDVVDFMVQYRESHFNFLKRLAATYHEWFFYDGIHLQFGKPADLPTIPVVYGIDLENIRISMKMAPVNFQNYSYHSANDETYSGSSPGSVAGLNDMGNEAMALAMDHFQISPKTATNPRIKNKDRLEEVLKNQQASAAAGLSKIMGQGTKQELRPGVLADIKAAVRENGIWASKPYGEYLIVNVRHQMTGNSQYSNSFEAIPAGVEVLPEPQFQMPVAEPQIARVTSNTDPNNQGRVEVQFLWQEVGDKSPFIRVMTPDAGMSDKVGQNRGLVFIPEVDDYVMVGFRYNDPMRPFVMGGMFNGTTGAGGSDENKMKTITTRSGNTVVLDDEAGSISIIDAKENLISLDGEGNIIASSSASITLSTGKSSISLSSDGTIGINGVDITINGSTSTTAMTGSSMVSTSESEVSVASGTVNVSGRKEVSVNGNAKTSISSSGKVELMGAMVALN